EARAAEALWAACLRLAREAEGEPTPAARAARPLLHRDLVLEQTGEDVFDLVFPVLIRLGGAYLDDGVAEWSMPGRDRGFYLAVRDLAADELVPLGPFFAEARRRFAEQRQQQQSADAVALTCLRELGLCHDDVGPYLTALLLTLPGWAGIMSRLERHPEDRSPGAPAASLLEFLAVRLTYELAALRSVLAQHPAAATSLAQLYRERRAQLPAPREAAERAFALFQVAQLTGLSAERLQRAQRAEIGRLSAAIAAFDSLTRRRVFQEAYERQHRVEVLSAIADQRPRLHVPAPHARPRFQLITCFDEREESFRRHVEEVAPDCQTFGAPGFFGAAMRFRAMDELHHVPLAPVVIKPTHLIEERPARGQSDLHDLRWARRVRWMRVALALQRGTRSFWRGMALNAAFGMLALFPLLTRLISPRIAGRVRSALVERLFPTPRTELTVHHDDAADLPPGVQQRGFKVDERVTRVATVLENIGLTGRFGRLVLVLGHGSSTLNNPHKSAYDCGACGGRQGGPNARVFCQMANDPQVRSGLRERGIDIPDDTW
ncbi:MAG TPA: putative inorganic carbon transporter subunit DabA, partial [Polyangiales bacterium]